MLSCGDGAEATPGFTQSKYFVSKRLKRGVGGLRERRENRNS
jgi:hypothetical protein